VQNNIEEGGGRFRMIQGEKPWPLLIDVPSLLLYNLTGRCIYGVMYWMYFVAIFNFRNLGD
jgi:hypothetical protein